MYESHRLYDVQRALAIEIGRCMQDGIEMS